MDRTECLIYLKGLEKTEKILSLTEDSKTGLYHVKFKGSDEKVYSYRSGDVKIYKPDVLNPDFYTIYLDGKEFTGLDAIYRYSDAGYFYLERGDKSYLIEDNKLKITHSVLENKNASAVLSYLKEVSFVSSIKDEDGNRILSKRYKRINFVDDVSVLADYLSGNGNIQAHSLPALIIYPFGTNKSQKKAVANALSNKISVVQGPPGTGKTQTILTIIANLILQRKTVEVVSNNNSAVDNVREKLERYGLSFLLASLGSADNKKRFISSQTGDYPDISDWEIDNEEIKDCCSKIQEISNSLDDYYEIQEEAQKKRLELSDLDTEILYFSAIFSSLPDRKGKELSSERLMKLLQEYSFFFQRHERFSFLKRIVAVFVQGSMNWKESGDLGIKIIQNLQWRYYCKRKNELQQRIDSLDRQIADFDMHGKEKQLSDFSLKYWLVFLIGFVAIVSIIWLSLPNWSGRLRVWFDKLPPWNVYKIQMSVGWLMSLSSMVAAGITIPDAMRMLADTSNKYLRGILEDTLHYIANGDNLGNALQNTGRDFPNREIIGDLAIYADMNGFDQNLSRVANDYLEESVRKMESISNLMNSLGVLIVSGIIAWGVLGTFQMQDQITNVLT